MPNHKDARRMEFNDYTNNTTQPIMEAGINYIPPVYHNNNVNRIKAGDPNGFESVPPPIVDHRGMVVTQQPRVRVDEDIMYNTTALDSALENKLAFNKVLHSNPRYVLRPLGNVTSLLSRFEYDSDPVYGRDYVIVDETDIHNIRIIAMIFNHKFKILNY